MPEGPEVDIRTNVQLGVHDGELLLGDYYAPQGTGPYPALVAVHDTRGAVQFLRSQAAPLSG